MTTTNEEKIEKYTKEAQNFVESFLTKEEKKARLQKQIEAFKNEQEELVFLVDAWESFANEFDKETTK